MRRDGRKRDNKKLKTYGKTAKLGALWGIARSGVRYVLLIPVAAIMARLLSPTEFGIGAAASFFLTLSGRVTELGLNASLVRIKQLRPEHSSTVFVTSLVTGTMAWLALTLAAPSIGRFFRQPEVGDIIPIAALAFLITPLSTVPSALLQRNFRYKANSVADWADSLTGGIVGVVLAWMGFSYWSLVYAHIASTSVNVGLKLYFTRWKPGFRVSLPALRELWSFGLGIQTKRLLQFGSANLDNFLIGRLISISALGLYDKAFNTTVRLQGLVNLGSGGSFRIFSIIHDDEERFRRAYRKTLLTVCVVSVPIMAGCIVAAPQLFEVMYGKRWLPSVPAFQILCFATIAQLISAHASQANEARGQVWRQAANQALYVASIVVGVWIGSKWGIVGAAAGVLTARLILSVMIQDLLRRAINATWRDMFEPAVPGMLTGCAVALVVVLAELIVHRVRPSATAFELLAVQTVVGGLVYVALIVFSPSARVREVVYETLDDFAPAIARRIYPESPQPSMPQAS